jgi:uncharacterized integral membrane protein
MKRFFYYLVLIPIAAVVLAFAFANREWVTLSFDPLNPDAPAAAIDAPLFIILFAVLIIGILLGGFSVWLKQGRHRRAARLARSEAERYRVEAERLRAQLEAASRPRDSHAILPSPVPF